MDDIEAAAVQGHRHVIALLRLAENPNDNQVADAQLGYVNEVPNREIVHALVASVACIDKLLDHIGERDEYIADYARNLNEIELS